MSTVYKYKGFADKPYEVVIKKAKYQDNDNLALIMCRANEKDCYDADGLPIGEEVLVITINTDLMFPSNQILVKNYSENEGLDKWLVENGISKPTGKGVESGFVTIPVHELLIDINGLEDLD